MYNGIRSMLPPEVQIVAGPGCPVCVVPSQEIDECVSLAEQGVTVTIFGDILRVPGTEKFSGGLLNNSLAVVGAVVSKPADINTTSLSNSFASSTALPTP